jgi:hypothetical protein
MSTLLEHALDAARRGLKVFPCHPRLKTPATTSGAKEMTSDELQIRKWWAQNPAFNIGCNAGVIVDVDSGVDSLEQAQNIAKIWSLPSTLLVRTGRRPGFGVQFHFTGDVNSQGPFQANGCSGEIRVLSRNYYGMWAGSVHPSGNVYEIIVDLPIAQYPPASRLAPTQSKNEDHGPMTIEEMRSKMAWLFRQASQAAVGNRNDSAHRATYFAARGFVTGAFEQTEGEIKKALFDAVSANYAPGDRDIRKMLAGSWQRGISHGPFQIVEAAEDFVTDSKGVLQAPEVL